MLTIKDFTEIKEYNGGLFIAYFGDYYITIFLEKEKIGSSICSDCKVIAVGEIKVERVEKIKKGQYNERLQKCLSIANKFYKEYIA